MSKEGCTGEVSETGEAPSKDGRAELSVSGASWPEQAGGSGRP